MKKYIIPAITLTELNEELMAGVHSQEIDPGASLVPTNPEDEEFIWLDEEDRLFGGSRERRLRNRY